ncbi:MAG TPA: glutaminyl-peptide cyclotransferase [Candidatus Dormibacteraeota bacterium]|nr:glutaminyl-peptide cyclotransferase [Candidatus Dormibacteraeota bacterium]
MPSVDRVRGARYRARVLPLLLALLLLAVAPASAQPTAMGVEVLASYPHDARAFTQGLLLHDGALYESTGLVGRSSLRQVELATGKVLRQKDLPPPLFGEGLAWTKDELVQLTWQDGRALRWDPATFEARGEWHYDNEGWGLCFDGKALVQSDGSHHLFFRDPATFALLRTLEVTENGQPVTRLNELECVGDTIYANVWMTDRIVAIASLNGIVRGSIDASGLLTPDERKKIGSEAILNGIAFDPSNNTFLLTGKLWPKLFRVRFVPR